MFSPVFLGLHLDSLCRLGLVLLCLLAYSPALSNEFLAWDDDSLALFNPHLVSPGSQGLLAFWGGWDSGYVGLYTPLSYTIWWVLAKTAGLNPWAFHALNIVIHCINCILVYQILRKILPRIRPAFAANEYTLGAVIGAAFFAFHPTKAESVAWVSHANGLLAACFGLASLLCYPFTTTSRRRGIVQLAASTLLFACALLCKPSALAIPPILVVLALATQRRCTGWLSAFMACWIPLTIAAGWIANRIQAQPVLPYPMGIRPLVALDAIGFYAGKLLFPTGIAVDYGRSPQWLEQHYLSSPWWALAAGLLIVSLANFKRTPIPAICLAILIAGITPIMGITPFAYQAYSTVADRYAYLASLALALFTAVVAMWGLCHSPRITKAATLALIIAFAAMAYRQTFPWRNSHLLADAAMSASEHSTMGNHLRAVLLCHNGYVDAASHHVDDVLSRCPDDWGVLLAYADALWANRRPTVAFLMYLRVLQRDPYYTPALLGLYKSGHEAFMAQATERVLENIVRQAPRNTEAIALLGWSKMNRGDHHGAVLLFEQALAMNPDCLPAKEGLTRVGRRKEN